MKETLNDDTSFFKEGYKKTKLGWFPMEWEIIHLGKLGKFSKGKGIAKNEILENDTEGYPSIRYAEIYTLFDYYTHSLKTKISEESANKSNPIHKGDILFAGSGETLKDIGKSVAYLGEETAYAGGDIIILKQNYNDSQYLGYLLNNDITRKQLYKLGQGHSVVHIYSSGLKKVLIPLPPLPEQQKIAQILSTWDKAIALQEQLIAEKQVLKKGLMQQLLTGKKRFPGFTEEWGEVKLREIVSIMNGHSPSNYNFIEKGKYPYLKVEDLNNCSKYQLLSRNYSNETSKLVPKGSVIFPKRGAAILNNKVRIAHKELHLDSNLMAITPKYKMVRTEFLFYKIYNEKLDRIADTSSIPQINNKHIDPYIIRIPSLEEQQKIAAVLSNFDTEIEKLIHHKESLIQQKQGLMHKLLTGEQRITTKNQNVC